MAARSKGGGKAYFELIIQDQKRVLFQSDSYQDYFFFSPSSRQDMQFELPGVLSPEIIEIISPCYLI